MAAGSSLIVISNRWDLECDDGVQSSWQQDCLRQRWLHWHWPKSPRLPFTLSRNEEGVLIRKAAAGELLDDHKSTWLRGQGDGGIDWGSTSVSRLMKIYWAPNQTKSRIGNTPWKDCESAIRSNFIWTIFRESSLKGGVLDLLEKKLPTILFLPFAMFGISYEHFVRWPCHCRGTSGHPGWIYNKNDTNRHGDKQRHRKELLMLHKSILNFKSCKYFKKWKKLPANCVAGGLDDMKNERNRHDDIHDGWNNMTRTISTPLHLWTFFGIGISILNLKKTKMTNQP